MTGTRLQHVEPDRTWRRDALCQGQDTRLFYREGQTTNVNKLSQTRPHPQVAATCGLCPVAGQCLHAGLYEPFGVWGGTTPYERHWLRAVLRGKGNDTRRPDKRRRVVVMGMAIRAGLLGEGP